MASKGDAGRRAGPKRSESSQAAILEAVRAELVASGWRGFSVDNVARRASASKQTIYRWWPSIAALCVESVLSGLPARAGTATEPVGRIAELLQPLISFCRSGDGQYAFKGAVLAAADDQDARDALRGWISAEVRGPLRLILAELAVKGLVRRDYDADEIVAHLLGPVWHRVLIANTPVSENFAELMAREALRALAPAAQPASR